MRVALVGFSNSGKTTVFNAMTGQKLETSPSITQPEQIHRGVLQVEDSRLIEVSKIVNPKKLTFATVECVDTAGFLRGNPSHNAKIIRAIYDCDALVYVLRGFNNPAVPYQFESIDPLRDFRELEYEFIMTDLDLVTKRIERIDEGRKKGQKVNHNERELLEVFREHLEHGRGLRELKVSDSELTHVRHLNFITTKPFFAVINLDEESLNQGIFSDLSFIRICGLLESEISQLPSDEVKKFLEVMNIDEPVSRKIIRKAYEVLNYISFFTAGSQEVRAWSIRRGTKALEAAGKIHSDIQRGFIRAEVIYYEDFVSVGGDMSLAKQRGMLRLEGKDYEVKDGDLITFRFKV